MDKLTFYNSYIILEFMASTVMLTILYIFVNSSITDKFFTRLENK